MLDLMSARNKTSFVLFLNVIYLFKNLLQNRYTVRNFEDDNRK